MSGKKKFVISKVDMTDISGRKKIISIGDKLWVSDSSFPMCYTVHYINGEKTSPEYNLIFKEHVDER